MIMKSLKILAIGAISLSAVAANALIMVDDYNTGGGSGSINSGSGYFFQNGTMIGGDRLNYLEITGNNIGLSFDVDVLSGIISMSKQPGVSGIGQVRYGYQPSGQTSAFQDLNMNFSGENQFKVTVLSNDLVGNLRLRLRSSSANAGMFLISTKAIAGGINSPTDVTWDYSEFAGMNFSDIDQVILEVATGTGGDIAFDNLRAVPEPATMILLGGAAVAALARKRRKA